MFSISLPCSLLTSSCTTERITAAVGCGISSCASHFDGYISFIFMSYSPGDLGEVRSMRTLAPAQDNSGIPLLKGRLLTYAAQFPCRQDGRISEVTTCLWKHDEGLPPCCPC